MMFYYKDDYVTIYHGNCVDILPGLPRFDLVLTDPPYGIGESQKKVNYRIRKMQPNSPFKQRITDYGQFEWDQRPASILEISLTINAGKKCILWGGNYFNLQPSSGWLVWDKMNGKSDFADCELAWTNLKQAVRMFKFQWCGMIRAGQARGERRVHPTQKPVELMEWCLSFVPDAKTVIDPFMGSGSTLRACKDLNIQCIGIDQEERYCEAAAKRMRQEVFNFNKTY